MRGGSGRPPKAARTARGARSAPEIAGARGPRLASYATAVQGDSSAVRAGL